MNKKISVIVPIYNVEKYLSKCIESIISQTYTNLEIILVEDGSPDNCGVICDKYSLRDNRIKVIHKKNGGLSDARNKGLDIASGDYISFVDSDDYICEEFYENLMNLIVRYDADISMCKFFKVFENDKKNYKEEQDKNDVLTILSSNDSLNDLFNENCVNTVVVWNKLYKKELFKNIRYPKGKLHEDEYTTYKILFSANRIISTSKKMYYYLKRPDSIMGEGFNIKRLDALGAYYEQVLFYRDNRLFELENKMKIKFEKFIRELIRSVSKSNLDDRNEIFHNLINYYRENYTMFSNNSNISLKRKFVMVLFKYSPQFIVRILSKI